MSEKKTPTYHEKENKRIINKIRSLTEDLPEFCKDFLHGIEPRTSVKTRLAYCYDLGIFFRFLYERNPEIAKHNIHTLSVTTLDLVTKSDIEEYLDYITLYGDDNSEYTNGERGKSRKLATLRSLYKYFYISELIETNPASKVLMPKIHEKQIIRLNRDEMSELLHIIESECNLTGGEKKYVESNKDRDFAIITFLLGTGMRVSELVGIDKNDLDFKNNGVLVRRKGGNESVLYYSDEVKEALLIYLNRREHIIPLAGHEEAAFLSMQKRRITVRSVENLVQKYSSKLPCLKHITPHKLRSTFGTAMYQDTGDIYLVANILGHSDVNTTRKHYAAINEEERQKAAITFSLRNGKRE